MSILSKLRLHSQRIRAAGYVFLGLFVLLAFLHPRHLATALPGAPTVVGIAVCVIAVIGGIWRLFRPPERDSGAMPVRDEGARPEGGAVIWAILIPVGLFAAYSLVSTVAYVLWSKYVGWPVVNARMVLLLRLVHLLPALLLAGVMAFFGGLIARDRGFLQAVIFAALVFANHINSYYRGDPEPLLLSTEAAALAVVSLICHRFGYVLIDRTEPFASVPERKNGQNGRSE